jgi:glutamyl-tRNA reductase
MKIGVIGISHDTATVAQRETYAKSQTLNLIKEGLSKVASVDEFAILSTCGRFEIYYAVKAVEAEAVKQVLINEMSLSQRANVQPLLCKRGC